MSHVTPSSGSIVVADWHRCKDSKEYFSKILHKKRRKNFGMTKKLPFWLNHNSFQKKHIISHMHMKTTGAGGRRPFLVLPRRLFVICQIKISKRRDTVTWVLNLVVGTKFDLFMHCDVADRDVRDFQETWSLPVLRVGGDVSDTLGDVAPLLNCLAENLWHQDCVTARSASHP
ncbi:ciliogenesis and planar polarity effector 2 [Etheostoma spectabile]|nr:ciliogenesis and planar polarity effector 2 [Etheostoma spectabile]